MPKFLVPVSYEYHVQLEVEAESKDDAVKQVEDLSGGDLLERIKASDYEIDYYLYDEHVMSEGEEE